MEVYALGEGPVLLFLHGMAADGSARWQQLVHFQDRYRVLAPTYPDAENLFDLTERILSVLDALEVRRFAVVGSSLGGYLAQYLVKRVPDRILAAVFANPFPPTEAIERKNRPLLLPERVVQAASVRHIERVIVPAGDGYPSLRYYLMQNARRLKKKSLHARSRAPIGRFPPAEPEMPHLLVEATRDPLGAAIRATYPKAARFVFQRALPAPDLQRDA